MNTDNKTTPDAVSQAQLHEASKALLLREEAALDGATLSALHKARSNALEQRRAPWIWWPAMGVTAAALITAVVLLPVAPQNTPAQESPVQLAENLSSEDLELLAAVEELEFLEELEFYAWLDQTEMDDV